jgi:hypothetical protein
MTVFTETLLGNGLHNTAVSAATAWRHCTYTEVFTKPSPRNGLRNTIPSLCNLVTECIPRICLRGNSFSNTLPSSGLTCHNIKTSMSFHVHLERNSLIFIGVKRIYNKNIRENNIRISYPLYFFCLNGIQDNYTKVNGRDGTVTLSLRFLTY